MGYRVAVLDPDPYAPAGQIANIKLTAAYHDETALQRLAGLCQAVTPASEDIPVESLRRLGASCFVAPCAAAIAIAQDRLAEKSLAQQCGCPTVPFANIEDSGYLVQAWAAIDGPALLKTRCYGHDGKGQSPVDNLDDLVTAFDYRGRVPCLLEARLTAAQEIALTLARSGDGHTVLYPVAEIRTRQGHLDLCCAPARLPAAQTEAARAMAHRLAEAMDYVGVLTVKYFVLADGRLLFNELAAQPHGSADYTVDACLADCHLQQVRALAGLPLCDPRPVCAAATTHLQGVPWPPPEAWETLLAQAEVRLHLDHVAAPSGTLMGHYTCLAATPEAALALATSTRTALGIND